MQNETNLNQILQKIPHGTVVTSLWLETQGISRSLRNAYKKNGWLKSFGNGAYSKLNDKVEMNGAIYALQEQLGLSFHIGGISALSLQGINHNIAFNRKTFIYGYRGENIPSWFNNNYKDNIEIIKTEFLPKDIGFVTYSEKDFSIKISSTERALLEMLYLIPKKNSLDEFIELIDTISVLNPKLMQELLEKCTNIKVKRVFLYVAEKTNFPWFRKIDTSSIDLGTGKRVIEQGGQLDKKYNIVLKKINIL